MNASPLETDEQVSFVEWLELVGLRFSALPLSTYTKSWSQKAKNRREGVRAGVPDMLVLIPTTRSNDGAGHALFIEMKRRTGGVVSPEQKAWIAALNSLDSANVDAVVCKGAHESIELVCSYLKMPDFDDRPF